MSAIALALEVLALALPGADDPKPLHEVPQLQAPAPRVGSVRVDVHGDGRATVSWRTDRPTQGGVRWGTGSTWLATAHATGTGREHAVTLEGLPLSNEVTYCVFASDGVGGPTETSALGFRSGGVVTGDGFALGGRHVVWHPVTIDFAGPFATERDTRPNPFLDRRLEVTLTAPDGDVLVVPGFFDGDGRGGSMGDVWRVRFAPDEPGRWSFVASFRGGSDVAVDPSPTAGEPLAFHGTSGSFEVAPRDPDAPGLYRWGKLRYDGEHHLVFADGPRFLKAGAGSPENLLAYAGFDNTVDQGGVATPGLQAGLHRYAAHQRDWGAPDVGGLGGWDDPLFESRDTGVDSRGLVGAIDYLASEHVNSLYFLPMNLGGDGWDVAPFVGFASTAFDKTHYDLSKLAQWNEVFEHAARRGILLHLVLGETEPANETWLDGGLLGRERKLFYRELVARFGHLPALKWNVGEEWDLPATRAIQFAAWIQDLDPYDHPIAVHSYPLPDDGDSALYSSVLGDPRFSANSMQCFPYAAGSIVERWRADSAAAGRKWVVELDEQMTGLTDVNAADLRKLMLYDVLFSGGNLEWYAGYHPLPLGGDLKLEDFRTRAEGWRLSWYARKVLEENVPFWAMEPRDDLVTGETPSPWGGAECLALPGSAWAVYYPQASATGTLDLSGSTETFTARWYDPRTGRFEGAPSTLVGGGPVAPGPPPFDPDEDWVLLVTR